MSEFTSKYDIKYSEENYRITFPYYGNEKDVDESFEKVLSKFNSYKLIRRFKNDSEVLDDIIEDVKNDLRKDGYDFIVEYIENGEVEMEVSIYSLEDVNNSEFKKKVLRFIGDVMDVLNGKKLVEDVEGFDINVMVEVDVSFYYRPKFFKPVEIFKDVSKGEKLHIGLNDIIIEKDKYSPYKYVTLLLSVELL